MDFTGHKKLLFIGNGFDLDLGRATSYRQFADSDLWPFKGMKADAAYSVVYQQPNGLAGFLDGQSEKDKWFDLESSIARYAGVGAVAPIRSYSHTKEGDEQYFNQLKQSLQAYILREEQKDIRKDSVAARLLKSLILHADYKVFSFNYTDLQRVYEQIGGLGKVPCEYLHGTVCDGNIILGIHDGIDVFKGYEFVYKTFQPGYRSHHTEYELSATYDVIFFGMSFGDIDYPYFQQFFKNCCDEELNRHPDSMRRITIFTYDQQSAREIKTQLRTMNDNKMMLLYNYNQLNVFCTQNELDAEMQRFLDELY